MKHPRKNKPRNAKEFIAGLKKRKEELARKGIDLAAGPPGRHRKTAHLPDVEFDTEEEDLTEEK